MKKLNEYIIEFKLNTNRSNQYYNNLIKFNYDLAKAMQKSYEIYISFIKKLYLILHKYIDGICLYYYINEDDYEINQKNISKNALREIPIYAIKAGYNHVRMRPNKDISLGYGVEFVKRVDPTKTKYYDIIVGDKAYVVDDMSNLNDTNDYGILYADGSFIKHNLAGQKNRLPTPEMIIMFKKEYAKMAIGMYDIFTNYYGCDISRSDESNDGVKDKRFDYIPDVDEAIDIVSNAFELDPWTPSCLWVVLDEYNTINNIDNTINDKIFSDIKAYVNKYKD